jgi:hypothetical protein
MKVTRTGYYMHGIFFCWVLVCHSKKLQIVALLAAASLSTKMCKIKISTEPSATRTFRSSRSVKGTSSIGTADAGVDARIRILEEENEKLAACALRVSSDIRELKRMISKRH